MAGINFMALAEGMMLGDKLNKEDETYWRKQRTEDIAAQNLERNQAYLEQTQSYELDKKAWDAVGTEGNRLVSQANDIYQKAASAQGKPLYQVLMESPDFMVPGASAELQTHVSAGIRSGIAKKVALDLRHRGDWRNAEALEQRFGMSSNTDINNLTVLSDKTALDSAAARAGMSRGPNGKYQMGGIELTDFEAAGIAINPATAIQTLINKQKVNDLQAQGQKTQETVAAQAAAAMDNRARGTGYAAATDGRLRGSLTPEEQVYYDKAMIEKQGMVPSGGANLVGNSAGSIDTYTAAPNTPPAGVPPASAAIKSVAPAIPNYTAADWRESLTGGMQTDPLGGMSGSEAAPPAFENAVNHLSSQELEALRYNITSGKGVPGMSAAASAVALRTINDEIASRFKAQQMRMQRGSKQ